MPDSANSADLHQDSRFSLVRAKFTSTIANRETLSNPRNSQRSIFGSPKHGEISDVDTTQSTEEHSCDSETSVEYTSSKRTPGISSIFSHRASMAFQASLSSSHGPDGPRFISGRHPLPPPSNPSSWAHRWVRSRRNRATAVDVMTNDLSKEDVIIAVVGPTGSGKSSFINTATGGGCVVGHGLESCTTDITITKFQRLERSDLDIVFVDSPGFDNAEKPDAEIFNMISDWLKTTYGRNTKLSGILYFHRISDNRIVGSPLENLRMLEELCGKNVFQHITLATTMWDEVPESAGEEHEKELKDKHWRAMINQGSKTARYHNTADSAWEIMKDYLKTANDRYAASLRQEIGDVKKELCETDVGRALYETLENRVQRQRDILAKIRSETKHRGDDVVLSALREEYENLRKQIKPITTLDIPLGRRLLQAIHRPLEFV